MKICIIGAGKIGGALAERLSDEGHDVTVVDTDEKKVESISNTLDIICYAGNGATYQVLKEAGAEFSDVVIASTATDELNMLVCLIAHKLGAKNTVARVRNPENHSQLHYLRNELGLSLAINPELATAEEIARVLRFPSAARVELFAKGAAELVECHTRPDSVLDGKTMLEASPIIGENVLVCAVARGEDVFIPNGNFVLKGGDYLYLTGSHKELIRSFKKVDMHAGRINSVMIVGGGRVSYYLASILEKDGFSVKLIEKSPERAVTLAENLKKTSVLRGDASDHKLLTEEGLANTDALVALTGLDECNILTAGYAKMMKVRKVIPKVNNKSMLTLAEKIGIDSSVSPKQTTADRIASYVRALEASSSNDNVELVYSLAGDRIEALEFKAPENGKYLDVPLKDLKLKKEILVAAIVRNGKTVIPRGADYIHHNDRVVIITNGIRIKALSDILEQRL